MCAQGQPLDRVVVCSQQAGLTAEMAPTGIAGLCRKFRCGYTDFKPKTTSKQASKQAVGHTRGSCAACERSGIASSNKGWQGGATQHGAAMCMVNRLWHSACLVTLSPGCLLTDTRMVYQLAPLGVTPTGLARSAGVISRGTGVATSSVGSPLKLQPGCGGRAQAW